MTHITALIAVAAFLSGIRLGARIAGATWARFLSTGPDRGWRPQEDRAFRDALALLEATANRTAMKPCAHERKKKRAKKSSRRRTR